MNLHEQILKIIDLIDRANVPYSKILQNTQNTDEMECLMDLRLITEDYRRKHEK